MHVCPSVFTACLLGCSSVWLRACISACLPFYLTVCLHVWMSDCPYYSMFARQFDCVCMSAHLYECVSVFLHVCPPVWVARLHPECPLFDLLFVCISERLFDCVLHVCMSVFQHVCMHASMHICLTVCLHVVYVCVSAHPDVLVSSCLHFYRLEPWWPVGSCLYAWLADTHNDINIYNGKMSVWLLTAVSIFFNWK